MPKTSPKIDRFAPSEVTLQLPIFAGEYLVMAGLSAAQTRLALVLLSLSWGSRGVVTIEKPRLEQLSAVVLNAGPKLLAPLLEATIHLPGHYLHDEPVFANIEFDGGKRGHEVGRVRSTMSVAMGQFLGQGANRTIDLPADELREYRTVSGIILRMRLAAAFASQKSARGVSMAITPEDVSDVFGSYGHVAVIKRPSTVTGEIAEHVSLSRASAVLVDPAVNEINRACRSMRVKATALMNGRKWVEIAIDATKLTVRATAPKPLPTRKILGIRGQPTRAVVKSVKL